MSKIFLVGMPASGKSTLGRKLARKLKYKFIDLDKVIETKEQKSINTLFKETGESGFRELERFYLLGLDKETNAVISTGGGTPAFFDNMEWMNARGLTIYLQVETEELITRNIRKKRFRPLFAQDSEEELRKKMYNLLEKRESYYLKSALIAKGDGFTTSAKMSENQWITLAEKILINTVDF